MKVKVSVVQLLRFEITKEVEISYTEYKKYLKTGQYENELLYDVSSCIDDVNWVSTKEWIDDIEKIK